MGVSGQGEQADAFAEIASTYEEWFESPLGSYVDGEQRLALDRLLASAGGSQVVELGAGTGHIARHLAERGYAVTALEPSPAMLAEGTRHSAGLEIRWDAAYAEALPFPDGSFDGALFFTTIEFVADPASAGREALRVVRHGGWLAIGFLNALSPWAALYRHLADTGQSPWTAARFFTRPDLEQLVGEPPSLVEGAVYLAPAAQPPFAEADAAGRRAGNEPALGLLLWRKL